MPPTALAPNLLHLCPWRSRLSISDSADPPKSLAPQREKRYPYCRQPPGRERVEQSSIPQDLCVAETTLRYWARRTSSSFRPSAALERILRQRQKHLR